MTATEHREEGGTTGEEQSNSVVSYFRCPYCGASERSRDISYSRLGFPNCPVCGTQHGP
jgi:predicted RNA-binding Zn-ribbon protein involved in translation (DUF1610 family)